jgi:hypothetical protein
MRRLGVSMTGVTGLRRERTQAGVAVVDRARQSLRANSSLLDHELDAQTPGPAIDPRSLKGE